MTLTATGAGRGRHQTLNEYLDALSATAYRFCAADLALADDAAVSNQWTDAIGGVVTTAQATGAKQPLYKTASNINSGPAVRFDGTDDSLQINSLSTSFDGQDAEHTVFVVCAPSSFATNAKTLIGAGVSTTAAPVVNYRFDTTAKMHVLRRGDANEGVQHLLTGRTVQVADTPIIATWRHNWRSTSGWVNGAWELSDVPQDLSSLTLNRFSIGSLLRNTESAYFAGDIADVVIVLGALSEHQRHIVESLLGREYGITVQWTPYSQDVVTDHAATWWTLPRAVTVGGSAFVGGVSSAGTITVADIGQGTRRGVGRWDFDGDELTADDHNTAAVVAPSDKPPLVFWADHLSSQAATNYVYWRKGTVNEDFSTLGARQAKAVSVVGQCSYAQVFREAATDNLTVFTRVANRYWHVLRSTDYAGTFGNSVAWLDFGAGEQGYMAATQLSDGNLRVVMYGHPVLSTTPQIRYCHIDISDGEITNLAGASLGNIQAGTNLPLTPAAFDVVYDPDPGVGVRLFDVSDASDIEVAFATWTTDSDTTYRYARWDDEWQISEIVAAGERIGEVGAAHYNGGMSFPKSSPGGIVFLSREHTPDGDAGTWTIEKATLSGTWSRTVLATSPPGRKYARPYALAAGDPYPLVFIDFSRYPLVDDGYKDYAGDVRGLTNV